MQIVADRWPRRPLPVLMPARAVTQGIGPLLDLGPANRLPMAGWVDHRAVEMTCLNRRPLDPSYQFRATWTKAFECQARPCGEIANGAAGQYLPRPGERTHPCAGVHSHPAPFLAASLALTDMHARSDSANSGEPMSTIFASCWLPWPSSSSSVDDPVAPRNHRAPSRMHDMLEEIEEAIRTGTHYRPIGSKACGAAGTATTWPMDVP